MLRRIAKILVQYRPVPNPTWWVLRLRCSFSDKNIFAQYKVDDPKGLNNVIDNTNKNDLLSKTKTNIESENNLNKPQVGHQGTNKSQQRKKDKEKSQKDDKEKGMLSKVDTAFNFSLSIFQGVAFLVLSAVCFLYWINEKPKQPKQPSNNPTGTISKWDTLKLFLKSKKQKLTQSQANTIADNHHEAQENAEKDTKNSQKESFKQRAVRAVRKWNEIKQKASERLKLKDSSNKATENENIKKPPLLSQI